MKERRKDPRFKTPERFKIKSRIRNQATGEIIYFDVVDLSMGGISFSTSTEKSFELNSGQVIDILIFRKNESVRATAEILPQAEGSEKVRARIVGISQQGREILADFLQKLALPADESK